MGLLRKSVREQERRKVFIAPVQIVERHTACPDRVVDGLSGFGNVQAGRSGRFQQRHPVNRAVLVRVAGVLRFL